MWPLTSFTKENGATLLWPGRHQGDGATELSEAGASAAVCEPGDALVWLGGMLHGAGANNSEEPRRGINVSYCLGWVRPLDRKSTRLNTRQYRAHRMSSVCCKHNR